ncbi:hypothetical protein ACN93_15465 [Gordonia paraffinivorans]|uniref:hypothetical protein n=1 Tax=Gordonia paraffinivorans TaxID=175628 RepID=UPI000D605855|nr:hypothetical protein [Gordonia paraffinivorans]PWD42185.1 hypothetical protein ACN93_15465 [Gordonia paraffinivorans]
MADRRRGILSGVAAVTIGVIAVTCALVVSLVVPQSVHGSATLPGQYAALAGEPGDDPSVEPLPGPPGRKWEVTADSVFGSGSQVGDSAPVLYLIPFDANDRMIVAAGLPGLGDPAAVIALDPASGKPLWPGASEFRANGCALSRDDKLACVQTTDDDEKATEVAFLDAGSGKVTGTASAEFGNGRIDRAGDGFLVTTAVYQKDDEGRTTKTETLTRFDSAGGKLWSQTLPADYSHAAVSEAGNVVVAGDDRTGVRAMTLPTGEILYDSADDPATKPKDETPSSGVRLGVAATGTGFAVSVTDYPRRTLRLFNSYGVQTAELKDVAVADIWPVATETDLIAVEGEDKSDNDIVGAVSSGQKKLLWSADAYHGHDIELLGGRYVAMQRLADPQGYEWTFFDATTGEPGPPILMSIYQRFDAFDGNRLIFEGDARRDEPGPPAFTAYDPKTGRPVWRLKETRSADEVNVRIVGPYLFVLDAREGPNPVAKMSRFA